jgi:hypothetical protein
MKDRVSAGPAVTAPVPVRTKIPVPTIAPMPIRIRSNGPEHLLQPARRAGMSATMLSRFLVLKRLTAFSNRTIAAHDLAAVGMAGQAEVEALAAELPQAVRRMHQVDAHRRRRRRTWRSADGAPVQGSSMPQMLTAPNGAGSATLRLTSTSTPGRRQRRRHDSRPFQTSWLPSTA